MGHAVKSMPFNLKNPFSGLFTQSNKAASVGKGTSKGSLAVIAISGGAVSCSCHARPWLGDFSMAHLSELAFVAQQLGCRAGSQQ